MKIIIMNGKKNIWYEKKVGKVYRAREVKDVYVTKDGAIRKEDAEYIYSEHICGIDSYTEVKEITKDDVIKLWEDAGEPLHTLVDLMQEEGLILIDGTLIC